MLCMKKYENVKYEKVQMGVSDIIDTCRVNSKGKATFFA